MHPAKPRMNMTPPTTMKSQTGSRPPRSVMDEMLDRTPWGETQSTSTQSEPGSCVSFRTRLPKGSQRHKTGWSLNKVRGELRLLQPQIIPKKTWKTENPLRWCALMVHTMFAVQLVYQTPADGGNEVNESGVVKAKQRAQRGWKAERCLFLTMSDHTVIWSIVYMKIVITAALIWSKQCHKHKKNISITFNKNSLLVNR